MISNSNSTSMGRQRLYHTAEEKLAANRAKSKRHYEKYALFLIIHYIFDKHTRVKNSLNQCRRRKYQKVNQKRRVIIGHSVV
jgi:predicted metallo-beta-lactamase superfamily hydrolase